MDRRTLLRKLADAIIRRKVDGKPLRVAIDGRSTAGKTTLAAELGRLIGPPAFQVLHPSIDGFHHPRERRYPQGEWSAKGYFEDAFNNAVVVETLLRPLSGQTFPVLCRQISADLFTDLPSYSPTVLATDKVILLFEGIFALRRELEPYWDFKILLDVDPDIALARAFVRNPTMAPDFVRHRCERRYEPAWQVYLERDPPEPKADVIIDNRRFDDPILLRTVSDGTLR